MKPIASYTTLFLFALSVFAQSLPSSNDLRRSALAHEQQGKIANSEQIEGSILVLCSVYVGAVHLLRRSKVS